MLKQGSGKLTLGTDFIGTFVDVDTIMLAKTAGLKVSYHPNRTARMAFWPIWSPGKSNIAFLNVATATANIGKFKPLAVTGARRLSNFPDVPTMTEAGYAGNGTSNWQGLFVSRQTPPEIVQFLHQATVKAMNTAEAKRRLTK